jgi:excisionase family DNA binding protein
MHNLVLSPIDPEILIDRISERVTANILKALKNEQLADLDRWFDVNDLCQYHPDKPTKPTVYGWVYAGTIPVHKGGKKLRFLKSEIDNWLKQGRKKTLATPGLKHQKMKTKAQKLKELAEALDFSCAILDGKICVWAKDKELGGDFPEAPPLWEIDKNDQLVHTALGREIITAIKGVFGECLVLPSFGDITLNHKRSVNFQINDLDAKLEEEIY